MKKEELMEQKGIVEVDTRKPEEIGDYKQKVYGVRHYKDPEEVEQLSYAGLEFILADIDAEIANLQRKKEHYQKAKDSLEEVMKLEPKIDLSNTEEGDKTKTENGTL